MSEPSVATRAAHPAPTVDDDPGAEPDSGFAVPVDELAKMLADELGESPQELRLTLYRLMRAGSLQRRRTASAREALLDVFGPSLEELDPVPHGTVEQARRLGALRARLLEAGAYSLPAIAEGRGAKLDAVRQSIRRARERNQLFTVLHEHETLVPAFLLDDSLDVRPEAQPIVETLREAGEDGWSLWAWFVTPSSWLGGLVPAEVMEDEPDRVARAAQRRVSNAS